MILAKLLNQLSTQKDAKKRNAEPEVIASYDNSDSNIVVYSDGKVRYEIHYPSGTSCRSFHIEECIRFFPFSDYVGLKRTDIANLEDYIVFTIYGEHKIALARNKVHAERSAFSMDDSITTNSESDDNLSFADIIADKRAITPEEAYIKTEVWKNYEQLTDKQKVVITGLLNGKTQVEIAKEEGVDATAIRDRLKGARKILK